LDSRGRVILSGSHRQSATFLIRGVTHYRFEIRYDAPATSGQRCQRRVRLWLPSTDIALAHERELRGEPPAESLTWGMVWARFRDAHEDRRSPGHIANQGREIQGLITTIGDIPIEATTLLRFSEFLHAREAASSPRQAQMIRGSALRVARWARAHGLIKDIPFEHVPQPEFRPTGRRPATIEEFRRILDALPPTMAPLWLALGSTGARITGMARLRESDVIDDYLEITTKGGQKVRYRLFPPLAQAVADARGYKTVRRMRSDFIFLNANGSPWDHRTFHHALRRVFHGPPPVTPHQLRHLWGTLAAEANFSPDMIQAALGHTDRRSAESYVDHTQAMRDRVAISVLATLMPQNDGTSTVSNRPTSSPIAACPTSVTCPACGHKFNPTNEKGRKPNGLTAL
jgi:integrase